MPFPLDRSGTVCPGPRGAGTTTGSQPEASNRIPHETRLRWG